MEKSYRSNYIQIYLWKTLSVFVGFVSFFVVVPFLTSNPQLYGIYSFCVSFQLYLSYADIGFLSAGQKYAAEAYAKGDQLEERRILGFVGAVLLGMVLPFSILMIVFAIHPDWVINGVEENNLPLITYLFFIMAVVTPLQVILQRLTQSILIIRVRDFISSRIDVIGSILKILSVFVFFTGGRYMIVPYFLFLNIVTIGCSLVTLHIIKREENYDIVDFIKSIKFSRNYFDLMKKLSFASLGATISWVICYELDLIYIGKLFSVEEVALYAVCFTIINFIRQFFNIIYGPYSQRYNHFVALRQNQEMSKLLSNVIHYTFPMCIFVCSVMCFSSKYFILHWVGTDYTDSILILAVLSWYYVFHFVSQPAAHVCISTERLGIINLASILCPIAFIGSFLLMYVSGVGTISFAISKILMMIVSTVVYYGGIRNWVNVWKSIRSFIPLILVLAVMAYVSQFIYPIVFPDLQKSSVGLMKLVLIMGGWGFVFVFCMLLLDRSLCSLLVRKTNIWEKLHL